MTRIDSSAADSPFVAIRGSLGDSRLTLEPPPQYSLAIVNVTNHCNLSCKHCFVFRDGNPNSPEGEMTSDEVLAEVERLRDRHGLQRVVWMGGEPMLRWRLLARGVTLFEDNIIATNGSIPLKDFGENVTYVISLDGPVALHDEIRGEGAFERTMATIESVPEGFRSLVMVQCVLHRENQNHLDELVAALLPTPVRGITFTFLVPQAGEVSGRAWRDVEEREAAVDIVMELKRRHPRFVWNSARSLDLMRPAVSKVVTDACPLMEITLPLYMEGKRFSSPLCCYGNDVDCDRCGSWGVFATAAKRPGPWDEVAPA